MYQVLYNAFLKFAMLSFQLAWKSSLVRKLFSDGSKTLKFVMGQRNLLSQIEEDMKGCQGDIYWFHCASFGEYGVIRPIIRGMRNEHDSIIVTFFSPSGYESLQLENQKKHDVDRIFYLPLDTRQNVRRFLSLVHPKAAIFAISEYWINYLSELQATNTPTYIVSSLIHDDSYLLRWKGRPIRKALKAITTFMASDEETRLNLAKMGFNNAEVIGDPLFDNAISIAHEAYSNTVIEHFCQGGDGVFIAGSVSDKSDLELVSELANTHRDTKFIVVPHELREENITEITEALDGKARLHSACDATTDFTDTQILIIDFMGSLSRIYRYGRWAYVGGGFTPFLHSIIEPVVYGIPVSFGPRIHRKSTPQQMIRLGIGTMVSTKEDIQQWFTGLKHNQAQLATVRQAATDYVGQCAGATRKVIDIITQ